jgi:arabinogalactan oligomer/maltooligosaccharide transport system substrate-binding protein
MKKWIAGAMAVSLMAMGLAGCGAKQETKSGGTNETKTEAKKLVVWSHLTQPEVDELKKLAEEWGKKNNATVEVLFDQTGFKEFAAAAQAGQGPDIMYGLPHDNLGEFWKANLLDPVPDGVINKADYEPLTIDAVSYDGKMFAVPVSFEAIGLFYNKKLVPEAPKTWDEFMKLAKEKGFQYDVKNFYFSYGFIGGLGGYVFKNTGGALDPKDVGLANDGAKAGFKLLGDFVNTHKLMPSDVSGDMAKKNFIDGKIAFYLSGAWDVADIQKAGVDFGVAPMPTLENGKPFQPFVGVQAAFVNAGSKNKKEAWDLIKYLQENAALPLFKTGNRIPAQKKFQEHADVKANALLAGFMASAKNGVPMPNIPAMGAVWTPVGDAINLVVTGKAQPAQAAENAVKAINEAVSQMK